MKRNALTLLLAFILFNLPKAVAQGDQTTTGGNPSVERVSFWHNWYVQAGVDMMLQNPQSYLQE